MVLNACATSLALLALYIMLRTHGCKNFRLLLLLLGILAFSVTMLLTYYSVYKNTYTFIEAYDLFAQTAENWCHWMITETYVLVAFQTRMLVSKNTYSNLAS